MFKNMIEIMISHYKIIGVGKMLQPVKSLVYTSMRT